MTDLEQAIERIEGENQIVHVTSSAAGEIVRSEVEAQLDAAHRYPRSITKFLNDARTMATIDRNVAESCMYALPRDGKTISGPSVRLAEICSSSYGNLQVAARVVGEDGNEIVAQGAAWDMQTNLRATIEVRRRITNKNGRRYSDDMVTMTGNAAASIALRNAIFRVIPRAYVDVVFAAAKRTAVGDAKSLAARRDELLGRLAKMGISKDRVLLKLGRDGVAEINLSDLETLIGLGTAIHDGSITLDEAFPEPAPAPAEPAQDGRRMSLKGNGKKKEQAEKPEPEQKAPPPMPAESFDPDNDGR